MLKNIKIELINTVGSIKTQIKNIEKDDNKPKKLKDLIQEAENKVDSMISKNEKNENKNEKSDSY